MTRWLKALLVAALLPLLASCAPAGDVSISAANVSDSDRQAACRALFGTGPWQDDLEDENGFWCNNFTSGSTFWLLRDCDTMASMSPDGVFWGNDRVCIYAPAPDDRPAAEAAAERLYA